MKLILAILVLTVLSCSGLDDIDIHRICIEGHIYYLNAGMHLGGIAPKLTNDGKPCPCTDTVTTLLNVPVK
jgi:hypothetical protein